MKRHPSLEPFSRDHNVVLALARRLKLAAEIDQSARCELAKSLVDCWHDEMEEHFSSEEELLLPITPRNDLRRTLLREHHDIARNVAILKQGSVDASVLLEVGTQLEKHTRWEERVLFPAIESSATEQQLDSLGKETASLEDRRSDSKWSPRRGELMNRRKQPLN